MKNSLYATHNKLEIGTNFKKKEKEEGEEEDSVCGFNLRAAKKRYGE